MSSAILITGAGTRIGAALAEGLAADDWAVCIHYNRSKNKALEVRSQIKTAGGHAEILQGNLNVPSDRDALIARASTAVGQPLTALINNASTFSPDTAETFTDATLNHHMDTNLRAPLRLAQRLAEQLPEGVVGNVINVIDNRVLRPAPDYFTYSLSKASLFWATKTMAQALAPKIRVNGIGPGPTLKNRHQTDAEFTLELGATLTGKGSPPETILGAARYLLSADAVTGQMIAVDGGQHLFGSV